MYMCVYIYMCIGVCGYLPPVWHRPTDPTTEIYTTTTARKLTEWCPGYIGHPIRHPKVNGIVSPHPNHHGPPTPPVSCHKYTPHAYVCIHTCEYKTHKIKKTTRTVRKNALCYIDVLLYLCCIDIYIYMYTYTYTCVHVIEKTIACHSCDV